MCIYLYLFTIMFQLQSVLINNTWFKIKNYHKLFITIVYFCTLKGLSGLRSVANYE